jgi:hypothetical protein
MIPKREKMYQMNTKCTKWSLNIPNVGKIFPMGTKYTIFSNWRPSKIYPNWEFWFENKPSGNPAAIRTLQNEPTGLEGNEDGLSAGSVFCLDFFSREFWPPNWAICQAEHEVQRSVSYTGTQCHTWVCSSVSTYEIFFPVMKLYSYIFELWTHCHAWVCR